jgi:uncharacterized protein YjiS (DUF1127 family)
MATQSVSSYDVSSYDVSSYDNVYFQPRQEPSLRRRIIETLLEWQRRIKSRRELAYLSDIELRDIGYPDRVEAEKAKPFWRA